MKPPKRLRPLRPNEALRIAYQRKIDKLIQEMNESVEYWLKASYRANKPIMAMDDILPANALKRAIAKMKKRWLARFDKASVQLAEYFSLAAQDRNDKALAKILKDGGFSVRFQQTQAMKDIVSATIQQNISLIKSIPQKYLTDVEGHVMRSIAAGRDLGTLSKALQKNYGVTRNRAAFIARSQNNLASASMGKARQLELGITQATWRHSAAGKVPRKTHVANNGKTYDVAKGWFDPHEKKWIQPGELPNCFPGSTRIDFAHNVEKAFRHFYSGELTKIVTETSKALRSTPNHPILTPHGWRPIGSLNEGDYVIEISDKAIHSIESKRDSNNAEPLISEIFTSLGKPLFSKISLGNEFHGDAIANSDIDIVFSARPLSFGGNMVDKESLKKFGLSVSDHLFLGHSSLYEFFVASLDATNSIMGGAREVLSLFGGSGSHPLEHSLAAVSNSSACSFDPALDREPLMIEFFRERHDTSAGFVQKAKAVRIVKVERCCFSGHVFNLQTTDGWYVAGGIISHNCRCVSIPIIPGFSSSSSNVIKFATKKAMKRAK